MIFLMLLKKFNPFVDKIIFVVDSYSWRKNYMNEKDDRDFSYKSGRVRDESLFDWKGFIK